MSKSHLGFFEWAMGMGVGEKQRGSGNTGLRRPKIEDGGLNEEEWLDENRSGRTMYESVLERGDSYIDEV